MIDDISLSDLAPFAMVHLGERQRIRAANTEAQSIFGHSENALRGRPLSEILYHDSPLFDLLDRAISLKGDVSAHDIRLSGPGLNSSKTYDVRLRPAPDSSFLIAFSETLTRDPVESAAGIAGFGRILGHEVKNPLAGITGAAQLLLRKADAEQKPLLDIIKSEANRIERLVSRLSAFELFSSPRLEPFNIHALLDKVLLAEEAASGGNVRIRRDYDPSLPEIHGDEDHLHEVFQNIVRNASEAARDSAGGGEISLQTAFETGFAFARSRETNRLERAIRITVEDNGKGIPATARETIFDMFSSTKSGGRGLGLSIVSEVVSAHGGRIKVDSNPGKTRFSVFLPMNREANS